MPLNPLATIADMEARGVTVDASETTPVTTYLDVASTIVREAAGSPISQTTSTITLESWGHRLHLPGHPVTAVSAVSVDGVAVTDYKLLSGALTRAGGFCGFNRDFREGTLVTVTYTHGLPTVPADIVDLVCRLVGQELTALRSGDIASRGITSERIGDYSVTYSDAETGTMRLSDYQRNRLAARFGNGAGVTVRSL
jgi:hypothetical protein